MKKLTTILCSFAVCAAFAAPASAATTKSVDWTIIYTSIKSLSISKGDSVKWTWAGTGNHDVVIRKGTSVSSGTILADSGSWLASGTFTRKFTSSGTFTAYCSLHKVMKQKITVK